MKSGSYTEAQNFLLSLDKAPEGEQIQDYQICYQHMCSAYELYASVL